MKKFTVLVALLASIGLAQAEVTGYGVLDVGVTSISQSLSGNANII